MSPSGAEESTNLIDPQKLLDTWNQNCGEMSKAAKLTESRKRAAKARLKENPDLEYWRGLIERIKAGEWCLGFNERGWKADFDWFLRPDTLVKIAEGKYDKREAKKPAIDDEKRFNFRTKPY